MSDVLKSISLDEQPEAARLVGHVRAANEPFLLTLAGNPVAIVVPLTDSAAKRHPTEADRKAFLSAAGGWSDEDADAARKSLRKAGEVYYRGRRPTGDDLKQFRAAAGGWKGFDADAFLAENRRSRDASGRFVDEA